jgi:hypothetical protein
MRLRCHPASENPYLQMKTLSIFLAALLMTASCKTENDPLAPLNKEDYSMANTAKRQSACISDLALIYQGGTHRLPWLPDQLKPYVYHNNAAGFQWLFDGFLFIEFKDNLGHEYAEGYGNAPAGKTEWQWLLDRNFERGKALDALNSVLDSLSRAGKKPARKRKVVLTLPEPITGFAGWGSLNGRALDFNVAADRIAACDWHIKTALAKWDSAQFKHLELAGFYWVAEQNTGAVQILPTVADSIHRKGKQFYWIPYYGAQGAAQWKSMGFDIAYQQPNYFFSTSTPYDILTGALDFAKTNKMALEMEFDNRVVTDPAYRERYMAYIHEFHNYGVWSALPVAYYEGGGGWLEMYQSSDTAVKKLYDTLANIIIKRQNSTAICP